MTALATWIASLGWRRGLVWLMGMLLCAATPLALADELREQVLQCAALSAPEARLRCFDGLAGALRVEAGSDQAGDSASATAPNPQADFGRESLPSRSEDSRPAMVALDAILVGVIKRPRGEHVFELSNGQTWTEISPGRGSYQPGIEVRIERTTLGGYMLSTPNGRATRVRRVE